MLAASPTTQLEPTAFLLKKGALGETIDGRTREGKFVTQIEAELLASLNGQATAAQKLAIRRISRLMLQSELLDTKLRAFWDAGNLVSEPVTKSLTSYIVRSISASASWSSLS